MIQTMFSKTLSTANKLPFGKMAANNKPKDGPSQPCPAPLVWNSLRRKSKAKTRWIQTKHLSSARNQGNTDTPDNHDSLDKSDRPDTNQNDQPDTSRKQSRKSTVASLPRKPNQIKMRQEVDKLWDSSQILMKKEGAMTEDDIEKLRRIIQEAVDLSGRIRIIVREKETYDDEDVVSHARDINNLQLFLHNVVEIWTKVETPLKEKYANSILADMMELATDISSVYGEVMATFLQRFGLDIVPLLRPVHGLFYSISIHCRYHCPDLAEDDVQEMRSLYNSFLTGMLGLMKSTKVLLKRLRFDSEVIASRRRLIQTNISAVLETMHAMVKDGNVCTAPEYVDTLERIGSLCTDIFFIIGKTSGIAELLELGEGVLAIEPAEFLGEVAHSEVQRCSIEQRPVTLKGLEIEEGGVFLSDVFVQTGSTFNPSQKVTLRMPFSGAAFPPGAIVKVKLKIGDEWYDTPGTLVKSDPEKNNAKGKSVNFPNLLPPGISKINLKSAGRKKDKPRTYDDEDAIEFQSKYMKAFVATVEYLSVFRELPPSGYNYVCPDDDRVRISFPEDCVAKQVTLAFRLIQINRSRMFDYKEQCPNLCRSILAVSDCLKVYHDEDVVFLYPLTVHLPVPNDIDDSDSEIVIFRSTDDGKVELIPKRTAMLCPSSQNCYTFQIQSLNSGISIGKVKKKNLRKNRSSVVEEYELYLEEAYICNILTFMDKTLLHVGMVKLVVEVVERRFMKKALRRRAKEGLFEVPGSRSPNIRLENEDIICIEMEGNIQRMKETPLENYFIVFLSSARDNFRSFPVEPRKDPDNKSYGVLNFFKDNEDEQKLLHGALIDSNKYLLNVIDRVKTAQNTSRAGTGGGVTPRSLGTSWATSRPPTVSARETAQYRAVFDDIPVLSHQSMLALSTYLKLDTVQNISYELGIPYDHVIEQKMSGQPSVMINFNILWKWRGSKPARHMVQQLIRAFGIIGHGHIGDKIMEAGNDKRSLTIEDFK